MVPDALINVAADLEIFLQKKDIKLKIVLVPTASFYRQKKINDKAKALISAEQSLKSHGFSVISKWREIGLLNIKNPYGLYRNEKHFKKELWESKLPDLMISKQNRSSVLLIGDCKAVNPNRHGGNKIRYIYRGAMANAAPRILSLSNPEFLKGVKTVYWMLSDFYLINDPVFQTVAKGPVSEKQGFYTATLLEVPKLDHKDIKTADYPDSLFKCKAEIDGKKVYLLVPAVESRKPVIGILSWHSGTSIAASVIPYHLADQSEKEKPIYGNNLDISLPELFVSDWTINQVSPNP
jgi:hypothetical protein